MATGLRARRFLYPGGEKVKGKRLLVNTIVLTMSSLLLRSIGLIFQVFLSRKMGAVGIGLFQLVMSVDMFAATIAISGIRFTATRLVSEELGSGREGNVPQVMRRCLIYAVLFGCAASSAMFLMAGTLAGNVVGDSRMELPLRILSTSLPFLSAGAVFGGYFTGVCRIGKSAAANISEQICKVAVSVLLMSRVRDGDTEMMCSAVALGSASGEIFSFFVALTLYIFDRKRYSKACQSESGITGRILKTALPLAASAYTRTALSTVHNLMIPSGLRRSGASAQGALAGYGTIHGMVFPVITFPSVIFSSVSELIVPELTEEQVRGRNDRIASSANLLLKLCLIFSIGIMGGLICFAGQLGEVLFDSRQVAEYIKLLAPLMPVMYLDSVTDGMLRGLGQQLYAMRVNIVDSIASTVLIYFLLPPFAIYGYIFILYASEIFNFALSMGRLAGIAKIRQHLSDIIKSVAAVFCAINFTRVIVNIIGMDMGILGLVIGITLYAAIYTALVFIFSAITTGEVRRIFSAIK